MPYMVTTFYNYLVISPFQGPFVISIPYRTGKQHTHGHSSREPVIKYEQNGQWQCLETREETLDKYKVYAVGSVSLMLLLFTFFQVFR